MLGRRRRRVSNAGAGARGSAARSQCHGTWVSPSGRNSIRGEGEAASGGPFVWGPFGWGPLGTLRLEPDRRYEFEVDASEGAERVGVAARPAKHDGPCKLRLAVGARDRDAMHLEHCSPRASAQGS